MRERIGATAAAAAAIVGGEVDHGFAAGSAAKIRLRDGDAGIEICKWHLIYIFGL